ncbi:hypothetical protein [Brevundimonas sp.]|uniref:hypothetical protein n=1 Tax=Brevundimonas sp. TaxID=1871086 RepID=UPI00286AEC37|nr:hypothetical protein [Brevundimonas sp.]
MHAWREWLLGNRGRGNRKTALILAGDVWEKAGKRAPATLPVIAEIEASAVEVYAAHGLPTRPGHYQRAPGASEWIWLAEELPADLRWALVLERPPEDGWRYATLEDIGRFPGASAELRASANLLGECRHLKNRLTGREPGEPGEDIQAAIRLGFEWHALKDAMAWKEKARLKLTTPSDALAAPAPEPEVEIEPEITSAAPPRPRSQRQPELDLGAAPRPAKAPRKPRKPRKPKTD